MTISSARNGRVPFLSAFRFPAFSVVAWMVAGLVTYLLAPRIAPSLLIQLLAHWKLSSSTAQLEAFFHKSFSFVLYEIYGLISIPPSLLIWRVRPRTRFRAFLLPAVFSVVIPAAGMLLGVLVFLTMLWFGPWPYLVFTPLVTANIGGFFWAAVMGEARWRIERQRVAEPRAA